MAVSASAGSSTGVCRPAMSAAGIHCTPLTSS